MAYPEFITSAQVANFMGMTPADLPSSVGDYIKWTCDEIQRRAGQPLKRAPVVYVDTVEYDVRSVVLPFYPVRSVTSVRYRDTKFDSVFAAIPGIYRVYRLGNLWELRLDGGFATGYTYEFTIEVGEDDVPGEIKRVALEMVAVFLKGSDMRGVGKGELGHLTITESDSKAGITKTRTILDKRPEWMNSIQMYAVV